MAFTSLTPGQTDADSPWDQTVTDLIRTNLDDLDTRISAISFPIDQGDLKTTTAVVSTAIGSADLVLPGGEYGFYPQMKKSGTVPTVFGHIAITYNVGDSYLTTISIGRDGGGSGSTFAQQRYVQASPPYKVGNKTWGHFLYMLVNAQGDIVSSYEAEDPPYAYNGSPHNKKDSIERIQAVPHPFADYHVKDPAIDGLEIVLVDLTAHNTKQWKEDSAKQGQGILENMGHINKKGDIITPQELGIADIQGFTDKVKIRKV